MNANEAKSANRVEVVACSGNVKPWRARVYLAGAFIGNTGFCATSASAQTAGSEILERAIASAARIEAARAEAVATIALRLEREERAS